MLTNVNRDPFDTVTQKPCAFHIIKCNSENILLHLCGGIILLLTRTIRKGFF